jgi:hypothetical protein
MRLTSPGRIPGPKNLFPLTSATASASCPSLTGTLLRTNSMAASYTASFARKVRTIPGFPAASKLVTRMFHPAGIRNGPTCSSEKASHFRRVFPADLLRQASVSSSGRAFALGARAISLTEASRFACHKARSLTFCSLLPRGPGSWPVAIPRASGTW